MVTDGPDDSTGDFAARKSAVRSTDGPVSEPSRTRSWDSEVTTDYSADNPMTPGEGPILPGYQVLGVLGRGGMGVVYKAHHLALDRTVALKVILGGDHASGEQRARFVTEAQAVAHLLHPNIVQIYEIGETQGLPYFSLEYVDGGSLDQEVRGVPQDPRWSAALVETIARAMHAAHQSAIIHRDLKPSNILLTRDGMPKITDFGLAKRLESDSGQTRTGSVMGTPSYMAPEQAWGRNSEVGPHADLYSIGAILYTLITGRPPFQGTSALETLEQVRTQEPIPPSRLQPKLQRDLETICLKCLQKEAEKRYESAEDLADDLRRFLHGEPIQARPISAPERLWRLARRNPRVAGLAASVLFLLVAVASISSTYAAILSRKNEELRLISESEKDARLKAEASVKEAFQQNGSNLETLRTLGRLALEDLKAVPGAQSVRQKILDKALQGLRDAAKGMEPLYQVSRGVEKNAEIADFAMAGAHKLIGDELLEMGQVQDALEHYRRMGTIIERAMASNPESLDLKYQLANNRAVLGHVNFRYLGDHGAAERYLKEALDLRRERLAREPDKDDAKLGVANALGQLAMCRQSLGEPAAAKVLFEAELVIREGLSERSRHDIEARRELSGLYERLGQTSVSLGDVPGARKAYDRCFAIRQALADEAPDHIRNLRDVQRSITEFGHVSLMSLNDPATARDYYRRALDGFRKLHEQEPSAILKGDIARGCYYLATALLRLHEVAEARRLYRECLDIRRSLVKDPAAKMDQIDLIVAMARCGEHEEAARIARRLIETPPKNAAIYIEVACALALCAGAASESGLKHTYTAETVAAIRKGIAADWKDPERLGVDPDLDPVRADPEFQRLLRDLQDTQKPPPARS
jgi:serine/threonine protein kinase